MKKLQATQVQTSLGLTCFLFYCFATSSDPSLANVLHDEAFYEHTFFFDNILHIFIYAIKISI